MSPHPLRLFGHRGVAAELPENTLASFERALEIGVDVIETDAHMTADGEVVLAHDPDTLRSANVARQIRHSNLRDVQSWDVGWGFVDEEGQRPFAGDPSMRIPTMREALERFPGATWNIDIKQKGPCMVGPLLDVVRDLDAVERVTLGSFHEDAMRAVRRAGYQGPTALTRNGVIAVLTLPLMLARRLVSAGQAIQIPTHASRVELASRRFIDKCHRLGLRVDFWTVNDIDEAEILIDRGADGLISDDPAALQPVIERHQRLR